MIRVPIAKEEYEEKAAQLWQQHGIEIAAPTGVIEKNGVTASYAYDGTNLAITVTHAPFPVSKSYCEKRIHDWLTEKVTT